MIAGLSGIVLSGCATSSGVSPKPSSRTITGKPAQCRKVLPSEYGKYIPRITAQSNGEVIISRYDFGSNALIDDRAVCEVWIDSVVSGLK